MSDFGPRRYQIHYDRDGNAISFDEWGVKHEDDDYIRVGLWGSWDEDAVTVSTVWLGINHNWLGGPPVIFETMIFGGQFDHSQTRYATEMEAWEGHQRTVADLEAGRTPWFLRDVFDLANIEGSE